MKPYRLFFPLVFGLALAAIILFTAAQQAQAATATPLVPSALCTWVGGNGLWSDPTKWTCGYVPDSDDDVAISASGAVVTINSSETITVYNLTVSNTATLRNYGHLLADALVLNGGVLDLDDTNGRGGLSGRLHLAGGSIQDGGPIEVAEFVFDGGTLGDSGMITVTNWFEMYLSNTPTVFNGRTLNILSGAHANTYGAVGAQPLTGAGGTINIASGAGFSITGTQSVSLEPTSLTINNSGIFTFNLPVTATGVLGAGVSLNSAPTGSYIVVNSGGLIFRQDTTFNAPMLIGKNAWVYLDKVNGHFSFEPGAIVSGEGLLEMYKGYLEVGTPLYISNLKMSSAAAIQNEARLAEPLTITQGLTWEAGLIRAYGAAHTRLTISPGATMTIIGASLDHNLTEITLDNYGTIVLESTNRTRSTNLIINNHAGAVYHARTTTNLDDWPTFNNEGLVMVSNNSTFGFGFAAVNSNGGEFHAEAGSTLQLGNGVKHFNNATTFTGAGLNLINGGDSYFDGTFTSENLEFRGANWYGVATLDGVMNWGGGQMRGGGNLTIPVTSTVTMTGTQDRVLDNYTLNNYGLFDWGGSWHNLNAYSGAVINNYGLWDSSGDNAIADSAAFTFNNYGTLRKSGGTTYTDMSRGTLHNTGAVEVLAGELQLRGNGTHTGSFSIAAGATLAMGQATHNLNAGVSVTGEGAFKPWGGVINLGSPITITVGAYTQNGGTVNMNTAAIHVTGDATPCCGGILNVQNGAMIVDGSLSLGTTMYLGSGALEVGGDFWTNGYGLSLNTGAARIGGHFGNGYGTCGLTANTGTVELDGSGVQNVNCGAGGVIFYNLTVQNGVTLAQAGPNVVVNGLLRNYGVIRRAMSVVAGSNNFGLTGVTMYINTLGTLSTITVDRIDSNHPYAEPGVDTGKYWIITPTGADYNVNLTLPQSGLPDPYACRYDPWGWNCARSSSTATTVTRNGITELSGWAVGSQQVGYHQADLAVSETAPASAYSGQTVTFTLAITNSAASDWIADGLLVKSFTPVEAIAGLSGSAPGGSCASAGAVITCTLNNLDIGGVRSVDIAATISDTFTGELFNTVTITPTDALDPDPSNNSDSASVTIGAPPPDVYVSKSGTDYAPPGGSIQYTLAWGNQGAASAGEVTLVDTLPEGVTFVSASGNPQVNGQTLTWNLGGLPSQTSGSFVVNVQAGESLPIGTLLVNNASIATTTPGDPTGNNTASFTTEIGDVLLTVEKTADVTEAEVGDIVQYTIYIRNDSLMPITATLMDTIPEGAQISGAPQATRGEVFYDPGLNMVLWSEADFEPLGEVDITFAVEVLSCDGVECGLLRNLAGVSVEGVQRTWSANADVAIRCPNLSVAVSSPLHALIGAGPWTASVTYQNINSNLAMQATPRLTVTLDSVTSFEIVSAFPPPTQMTQNQAVWALSPLAPGASGDVEVVVNNGAPEGFFESFNLQAEIQDTASLTRPPECQANLPDNEAVAATYGVSMEFEKRPIGGLPDANSAPTGFRMLFDPLPKLETTFGLFWNYHNYNPARPAVVDYLASDLWPQSLGTIINFHSQDSLQRQEDSIWVNDDNSLFSQFSGICFPTFFEPGGSSSFPCNFEVGDSWKRLITSLQEMVNLPAPGTLVINEANINYTLASNEEFEERSLYTVEIPHFAPLITAPESGQVCPGPLNVQGLAQPGVNVIISDTVSGEQFGAQPSSSQGQFDVNGTLTSGTHTLAAYSHLFSKVNAQAGPSNAITLQVTDDLPWDPQKSLWETTIQGMPVTYRFRNGSGEYNVNDWQIAIIPAHSQSTVSIFSCASCPPDTTPRFKLIADGVEYQESSSGGDWHYFNYEIEFTHEVQIIRECVDADGNVVNTTAGSGVVLVDPDGFVFDVDDGGAYDPQSGMYDPVTPIEGITVTAYMSYPQWGGWVPWPAHMYGQTNPQVTTGVYSDGVPIPGYFAFFTPAGQYYLQVEGANGYQSWRSPVVEVITEIVHVNVPLALLPADNVGIYAITLTVDGPDPAWITIPVGSAATWGWQMRPTDTITDVIRWVENPVLHPSSDLNPLLNTTGFDAGYLLPGQVYQRQFHRAGTYNYTDALGHTGTVVVTGVENKIYLPLVMRQASPSAQDSAPRGLLVGLVAALIPWGVAIYRATGRWRG